MSVIRDVLRYLFGLPANSEPNVGPAPALGELPIPVEELTTDEHQAAAVVVPAVTRDLHSAFVIVNLVLGGTVFLILGAVIVGYLLGLEQEVPVVLQNTLSAVLGYFGGAVASYFGSERKS